MLFHSNLILELCTPNFTIIYSNHQIWNFGRLKQFHFYSNLKNKLQLWMSKFCYFWNYNNRLASLACLSKNELNGELRRYWPLKPKSTRLTVTPAPSLSQTRIVISIFLGIFPLKSRYKSKTSAKINATTRYIFAFNESICFVWNSFFFFCFPESMSALKIK